MKLYDLKNRWCPWFRLCEKPIHGMCKISCSNMILGAPFLKSLTSYFLYLLQMTLVRGSPRFLRMRRMQKHGSDRSKSEWHTDVRTMYSRCPLFMFHVCVLMMMVNMMMVVMIMLLGWCWWWGGEQWWWWW